VVVLCNQNQALLFEKAGGELFCRDSCIAHR
jgi:hypothetical protein